MTADTVSNAPSIDPDELRRFAALADDWWNPNGKFRPLHKFNPVRLGYIKELACFHFGRDERSAAALAGLKILDIGCGGGLLSEPLARMGATMTGIDPGEAGIQAARIHADKMGLSIDYRAVSAEALVDTNARFDIVLAMEVVEHVTDVPAFVSTCAALIKPGGLFVAATINRTPKAYALAIIGAERIMRWLPPGTHQYKKLVTPKELIAAVSSAGLAVKDQTGVVYRPVKDQWARSSDMDVNYMVSAEAPK